MTRAVALIDGEHYVSVVREALAELPFEFVGAILVGGTEKLRGGEGSSPEDYGVQLQDGFDGAEVVVDLSDEPVLGPAERLRWASRALASGLPYVGADFRFDPPNFEPFPLPSVAVIGTGKRVGKTAVTGHVARLLALERDVVVVAMGRGGPSEPEVIELAPTVENLVALSRSGRHAASDHLETAALAGVPTIGCWRAGGGLAGKVFASNVLEGARIAVERAPEIVVFDGSGAALPPVATGARILVTSPAHDSLAFLNAYRVLVSDLVLLMHGSPEEAERIRAFADVPVLRTSMRLQPFELVSGKVAVFTAGPADVSALEADVVAHSSNLSNRPLLRADLDGLDADTYLVEIKAAGIDVVAEHGLTHGRRVVFLRNEVVALDDADLDGAILELATQAVAA